MLTSNVHNFANIKERDLQNSSITHTFSRKYLARHSLGKRIVAGHFLNLNFSVRGGRLPISNLLQPPLINIVLPLLLIIAFGDLL